MSEDVVYSEVKYTRNNRVDINHSVTQTTKSCLDYHRLLLLALCFLLVGGIIALSYQYIDSKQKLQYLQKLHTSLRENLTETLQELNHSKQILSKTLNDRVSECAKDWEYFAGKCYLFSANTMNWTQSRDACISDGGHLTIINSEEEQEFLKSMLRKSTKSFWIGLTDEENENQWLWVDRTKLNEDKRFWIRNEPDNWKGKNNEFTTGEDCAHVQQNTDNPQSLKNWYDAACSKLLGRICETKSPKQ